MSGYVSNIQPGNKALEYIDKRLLDNNYRGEVSSQHNRYDMEEIYNILSLLDKYAPNSGLMRIRHTDLKKRPTNNSDEKIYGLFCDEVNKVTGKGTQDSLRKNIFPDLHRMGLINRYDSEKNMLGGYDRKGVGYISLSNDGKKFINADLMDRAFVFAKAVNALHSGYTELSLNLLRNDDYHLKYITKWEFMFFVSAVDVQYSYHITMGKCVDLIHEYRRLGSVQRKAVVETLKAELRPERFSGNKTNKRDWHNWQNKIDQVFHLFKQAPYFDVEGKEKEFLTLSTKKVRTKKGELVEVGKRSISEKLDYFKNHNIQKKSGFELHHVVPLAWASSLEQFKLFDKWMNMVYIDGYSHSKITHNKSRNIVMSANKNDIILSDGSKNKVYLTDGKCIIYNKSKQALMLDYNKQLRTTI